MLRKDLNYTLSKINQFIINRCDVALTGSTKFVRVPFRRKAKHAGL